MDRITLYAPDEHTDALQNIRTIPFAKTDDGYQFAYWIYELNEKEEKLEALKESNNGEKVIALLEDAKQKLKDIVISEDDYLSWTVHKKEAGGVEQYHKVIHDLSVKLFMLSISKTTEDIISQEHKDSDDFYTISQSTTNGNEGKKILNRNNHFADVTIRSQQFFYKTESGDTETLFFNTNNIVEKIDKNGHDMLSMRPGFTVSKEHGVVQRPMQKVTFSNSMTESIVGDEDHIYIHID